MSQKPLIPIHLLRHRHKISLAHVRDHITLEYKHFCDVSIKASQLLSIVVASTLH